MAKSAGRGLSRSPLWMQVTPPIKQPQHKDALRQALVLSKRERLKHIRRGSWLRRALGAPADRDVCVTGFLRSMSRVIEIVRLYGSAGVRCDITETQVTCHDLPGIGGRRSHERMGGALVGSSFPAALAGCRHQRIRHGGTPGYATHEVCAILGAPSPRVMSSDEWNRTPGRIWAKASWKQAVGCTRCD